MWFQIVSSDIVDSRLGELCCEGAEESKRTPGKSQIHVELDRPMLDAAGERVIVGDEHHAVAERGKA
jgi:hypothetical protein